MFAINVREYFRSVVYMYMHSYIQKYKKNVKFLCFPKFSKLRLEMANTNCMHGA